MLRKTRQTIKLTKNFQSRINQKTIKLNIVKILKINFQKVKFKIFQKSFLFLSSLKIFTTTVTYFSNLIYKIYITLIHSNDKRIIKVQKQQQQQLLSQTQYQTIKEFHQKDKDKNLNASQPLSVENILKQVHQMNNFSDGIMDQIQNIVGVFTDPINIILKANQDTSDNINKSVDESNLTKLQNKYLQPIVIE